MKAKEKQKMADAISTRMRSIAEERDENLQFDYDVLKLALAALTAQPVKLPDCVDDLHGIGPVMSADEVESAIRAAGYEVHE